MRDTCDGLYLSPWRSPSGFGKAGPRFVAGSRRADVGVSGNGVLALANEGDTNPDQRSDRPPITKASFSAKWTTEQSQDR
jgi:hypothetical protein